MAVSMKRKERLWQHLLNAEKEIGGELRKMPRYDSDTYPMRNFCPDLDRDGRMYEGGYLYAMYWPVRGGSAVSYPRYRNFYEDNDSVWWDNLSDKSKLEVTNWVIKKIAERSNL